MASLGTKQIVITRLAAVVCLSTLLTSSAAAKKNSNTEPHEDDGKCARLLVRSAFFHGYMHGYDLGFEQGDLDIHMFRNARDPRKLELKEPMRESFRSDFGDWDDYQEGFKDGARVAYADAYNGRNYRSVEALRTLAAALAEEPTALPQAESGGEAAAGVVRAKRDYDSAIRKGYVAGRNRGLSDGRSGHEPDLKTADCRLLHTKSEEHPHGLCDGFLMGYRLGYADGFQNVTRAGAGQSVAAK